MKKFSKQDQRALATWAADCAERVLPYFENAYPDDDRPRQAIQACRTWVRTGVFKMAIIRGASLSAHAAARKAKGNGAACFAARAAGQAVATAHVPQHAFGGAYYVLKAITAADTTDAVDRVPREYNWQVRHIPKNLKQEVLRRVVIQKGDRGISVKIIKGTDF